MNDSFVFEVTPFYFLRHGETPETEKGILQGQSDSGLSAKGRKTAEDAAARLAKVGLRSIYASPLMRAWQTASIISAVTGVPVQTLPGLMERDWGVFQGRPIRERPSTADPETVETMADFTRRIFSAMRSISGPSPILIVSHSGVFRVLARHAGVSMDLSTRVRNAQPFLFDPSGRQGAGWRISEVKA